MAFLFFYWRSNSIYFLVDSSTSLFFITWEQQNQKKGSSVFILWPSLSVSSQSPIPLILSECKRDYSLRWDFDPHLPVGRNLCPTTTSSPLKVVIEETAKTLMFRTMWSVHIYVSDEYTIILFQVGCAWFKTEMGDARVQQVLKKWSSMTSPTVSLSPLLFIGELH